MGCCVQQLVVDYVHMLVRLYNLLVLFYCIYSQIVTLYSFDFCIFTAANKFPVRPPGDI